MWRRLANRIIPAAAVADVGRVRFRLRWPGVSTIDPNAVYVAVTFTMPPGMYAEQRWQHWPSLEDWMRDAMGRHAHAVADRLEAELDADTYT